MRTKLRPNRYKPCLVSRSERWRFRDEFFSRLEQPLTLWRIGEWDDLSIVAFYWVEFLKLWRPRHWYSGRIQNVSVIRPDLCPLTTRLRSAPEAAHRAFALWAENPDWIRVREDMPDSIELLNEQCEGRRVITLITDYDAFLEEVNGRDPLSFLLHDLVHAYQFFADPELKQQQIQFYREIRERLNCESELQKRLRDEPMFAEKFEYLIADMNSHPAHLRAYYEHILAEAEIQALGQVSS